MVHYMDRNFLLLVAIIALFGVLLVAGCCGFTNQAKQTQQPQNDISGTNTYVNQQPQNNNIPANNDNTILIDTTNCKSTASVKLTDICYDDVARSNQDARYCEKIQNIDMKYTCLFDISETTHNEEICTMMYVGEYQEGSQLGIWTKDFCYYRIARYKKELNICENIQVLSDKYDCYLTVADERKDPTICNKILDVSHRDSCFNILSISMSDYSFCDKINSPNTASGCFYKEALSTLDWNYCEKVIGDSGGRNNKEMCYFEVGSQKHDASICDRISGGHFKDQCYSNVVRDDSSFAIRGTFDINTCKKINDSSIRSGCEIIATRGYN